MLKLSGWEFQEFLRNSFIFIAMMTRNTFVLILLILELSVGAVNAQTAVPTQAKTGIEASLTQARELLSEGKFGESIKILQSVVSSDPQNASGNFLLGKAFYAENKYQNAIERLTISLKGLSKTTPEYREAVQMLGLSQYISGHLAEAIPLLEQLSSWAPNNVEITYALGVSYVQTRQPEKSRATFARLFSVPTNSAAAYLLNGQMLFKQQFEETAEIELNKALEIDPKLAQTHFILGELAIYRADLAKGIEHLQKEIELNPNFAMSYYILGEALTRQAKWDEAIAPLQKSVWLNPFFSGPYIVLGKVYLKKNDLGRAESMLRYAASVDPKNFSAHHLLAQVLQQAGKTEEAKKEFVLAEQLRPSGEKQK